MNRPIEKCGTTWRLPLDGAFVESAIAEWQLELRFRDDESKVIAQLSIEAAPRIGDGSCLNDVSLEYAARFLDGREVRDGMVSESGAFILDLAEGQRCCVEPDDEFEAWTFVTAAGERIVSMPGGQLAVWSR